MAHVHSTVRSVVAILINGRCASYSSALIDFQAVIKRNFYVCFKVIRKEKRNMDYSRHISIKWQHPGNENMIYGRPTYSFVETSWFWFSLVHLEDDYA
jgi:hypothetical protein